MCEDDPITPNLAIDLFKNDPDKCLDAIIDALSQYYGGDKVLKAVKRKFND